MGNAPGRKAISVTLDESLHDRIEAFCAARVMGAPKFFEIAAQRLMATAPPLPADTEPDWHTDYSDRPVEELIADVRDAEDDPR